jgi:hypothetical protein
MTEKTNENDFSEAIAKDWHQTIMRDLSAMSPGQFAITKQALSEFENQHKDRSQADFARKVSKMSDREIREFVQDCDDERRRATQGSV